MTKVLNSMLEEVKIIDFKCDACVFLRGEYLFHVKDVVFNCFRVDDGISNVYQAGIPSNYVRIISRARVNVAGAIVQPNRVCFY